MFNLGMGEILVLAVIALIVVGPEKLPSFARNIGRFINDIKRTTSDVTREISRSLDDQKFNQTNVDPVESNSNDSQNDELNQVENEKYADHGDNHDHDHDDGYVDEFSHHIDDEHDYEEFEEEDDQQLSLIDDKVKKDD